MHSSNITKLTCYDVSNIFIPREARAEGPSVARLINLSGRAGPSGAKPREFERKIYLYIYIYICMFIYLVEGVRNDVRLSGVV